MIELSLEESFAKLEDILRVYRTLNINNSWLLSNNREHFQQIIAITLMKELNDRLD